MGGKHSAFKTLLNFLEEAIITFPDMRTRHNKIYEIRDAVLSAFSVFFLQCPSFLAYQRAMQTKKGKNNVELIFGVHKIPTDTHIRNLLDPIPPEFLFPVFRKIFDYLHTEGIISTLISFEDTQLIALDGTWFFSSEPLNCDSCLSQKHKDGTTTYYHSAITPVIVQPGNNRVISLPPEFIIPQDGTSKQDCENQAAKRWIKNAAQDFKVYPITLLGDDLYSRQPVCEKILSQGYNFILTCKSSSHKYLFEWIDAYDNEDLNQFTLKTWTGKKREYHQYRFINDVPLKDGKDAMHVNWVELTIYNAEKKIKKRFCFVTNHKITRRNVISLVEAGRCRWKIENENNNTLKTKGYHLEHNFGHGSQYLSNFLMTLNLLAFLFHTVLELFDRRYLLLRKSLSGRKTFFNDIKGLTKYMYFKSWNDLLIFMIHGLELDDPGG